MLNVQISTDTRLLADRLMAVPIGEIITLSDLGATISRDIRVVRYLVYSAMRHAAKESGALFSSERGIGWRRLNNEQISMIGTQARRRMRRIARAKSAAMQRGLAVANDITPEAKSRILAEVSSLGLLEHIARDRSLPVMKTGASAPMPIAEVGQEFLRKIGAA